MSASCNATTLLSVLCIWLFYFQRVSSKPHWGPQYLPSAPQTYIAYHFCLLRSSLSSFLRIVLETTHIKFDWKSITNRQSSYVQIAYLFFAAISSLTRLLFHINKYSYSSLFFNGHKTLFCIDRQLARLICLSFQTSFSDWLIMYMVFNGAKFSRPGLSF